MTQDGTSTALSRAIQATPDGGTVCVSGNLTYQLIGSEATKPTGVTVTQAPSGGSIDMIDFGQDQTGVPYPDRVEVKDIPVILVRIWGGNSNKLTNVTGKDFQVLPPASNTVVQGGSYGPCDANGGTCTPLVAGTGTVVNGARLHHQVTSDAVCCHVDGMFIRGCHFCVVSNSSFDHNMVTNIRIQNCCGLTNDHLQLLNNRFDVPYNDLALTQTRGDGVDIDNEVPQFVADSNVFEPTTGFSGTPDSPPGDMVFRNNKMRYIMGPCPTGVTFENDTVKPFSDTWGNQLCGTDQWGDWTF